MRAGERLHLALVRLDIVKASLDSQLFRNSGNADSIKKTNDELALLRNGATIKKVAAEKDSTVCQ